MSSFENFNFSGNKKRKVVIIIVYKQANKK